MIAYMLALMFKYIFSDLKSTSCLCFKKENFSLEVVIAVDRS